MFVWCNCPCYASCLIRKANGCWFFFIKSKADSTFVVCVTLCNFLSMSEKAKNPKLQHFWVCETLYLIGNKLISPRGVCFIRDSTWWVNSPCPYLDPWAFPYIFSPVPSWGVTEKLWWASDVQTGSIHHSSGCLFRKMCMISNARFDFLMMQQLYFGLFLG